MPSRLGQHLLDYMKANWPDKVAGAVLFIHRCVFSSALWTSLFTFSLSFSRSLVAVYKSWFNHYYLLSHTQLPLVYTYFCMHCKLPSDTHQGQVQAVGEAVGFDPCPSYGGQGRNRLGTLPSQLYRVFFFVNTWSTFHIVPLLCKLLTPYSRDSRRCVDLSR